MKTIVNRYRQKTPKFFRRLRNAGLTLAAVSTAMLAGPQELPNIVTQAAGYLAVAGGVISAVSQAAVDCE